jgi:tight adherence protein B
VSTNSLRRLAAAAVGVLVLTGSVAVSAQTSDAPFTQVRGVRSDAGPIDVAYYFASGSGGSKPSVSVNGTAVDSVDPGQLPAASPMGNALVFDTSDAMDSSGALASAKEAARAWIRARTADPASGERFAIYTASDTGKVVQSFTNNQSLLLSAIDQVGPSSTESARSKTALWSAVRQAAGALVENSTLTPNLVIMAGQNDNASRSDKNAAIGQIASARAAVLSIAYTGGGYNGDQIKSLSDTYGGELLTTADGTQFGAQVATIAKLIDTQQFSVGFASPVPDNQIADLQVVVGDQTALATYTTGTSVSGYQNLNPAVQTSSSSGVSFLQGGLGLALAILLVLVAVALAAYAIFLLMTRDHQLHTALQPYSEGYGPQDEFESDEDTSYAKTAIVQRAVEATENFAESKGYLLRAETALERANVPLRAGEALFFYAAAVAIATILGFALGGLFIALIFGGILALTPPAIVSFLAGRRRRKFVSQLPDTLHLLSGTLRAGYSLMQGVEAVSQEVTEPMGQELRRVVTEARLGRPLEESLDGTAERMDSKDFAWAVMAIRIQREVGGNLSELLLTVADTMTQRERLRRDISALTAEGRMSAIVLGLLPVLLGLAMYVMNPEYMSKLFTDTLGNILLGGSVVAMLVGFVWMKKIIDIEI